MTATHAGSLTAQALAGTAHSPHATPVSGAPVDAFPLPGDDAGRDLLLRAGAAAIYRAAGHLPERGVAPLERAPAESRALCPPEAAALIEAFIVTNRDDLLLEAAGQVARRGELLPPALLPVALKKARAFATAEMRAVLAPVVGERGRWLARHNEDWSWLLERTLPGERDALPTDAETIWQEGTTGQRIELLGRMRAHNPALAREWLEGVWKKEKAETRALLIIRCFTGLSLDDEPLLEAALDDRSKSVRNEAADLLARLPGSALSGRIRERADRALTYDGALLDGNPPKGAPPIEEADPGWARDGLPDEAIYGEGGLSATYLRGLLERTPPSHWTERFSADPTTLIAASAKAHWRSPIFGGWAAAAITFKDHVWASAIWDTWLAMEPDELKHISSDRLSHFRTLARVVQPDRLESLALRLIAEPNAYVGISPVDALGFLERPWSVAVAQAYLDGLRAFAGALTPDATVTAPWDTTLETAALALPEAVLAGAREPITVPESTRWQIGQFGRQLDAFAETIRLRERLGKVLPL